MKVVILCGGKGTRMREETEYRPKPMVEVGGKPVLWHIMKRYAHFGHDQFVLCLGYRGNYIKEYFLNYEAMNSDCTIVLGARHGISYHGAHGESNFQVTLADTGEETMTGGRIKRIAKYVDDETFLLTYGDGLCDVDINKVLEFHRAHGKLMTVTSVRPSSRFGILEIAGDGHVESFFEKPQLDGWISAGYFVCNRKVFDYIENDDSITFERGPMERLAREGQLVAYKHDGFFFAMDTYREYQYLNEIWSEGKAPWKTWP
jgi:glucose-1-phosphate cytidylyltransferase